ncbi:MAG: TonB family protein [Bacteroidales bacterium]|nr:TonB family protein [Bacteroidales bacterium]
MRHILSTIVLIALSFGLLHAQGEKALLKARKYEAAGEKQWPKALNYYRKAANEGNLEALFKVAENDLLSDQPCEQIKTIELLNRLEDADAFKLSNAYRKCGDMEKAIHYLKKAVDANHVEAVERLGDAYWCGRDVKEDKNEAFRLYQQAANLSTGSEKQRLLEKVGYCREYLEYIAQHNEPENADIPSNTETEHEKGETKPLPVEDMPEYSGGIDRLMNFLRNEVVYPEKAQMNNIRGTNLIEFAVEKDGCVAHAEVKVSLYPACDEESVRAVSAMPPWKPGKSDGRLVRCLFEIPITYTK